MLYDASEWTRFPVLTVKDMREKEREAFDRGVPGILLMEHAAMAVVDELEKALGGDCRCKNVLFLCGTGNNGGDGLAAARLFLMRGGRPTAWLSGMPKTEDAKTNLQWLQSCENANVLLLDQMEKDQLPFRNGQTDRSWDGYVDALFGTGFHGEVDELTADMMRVANQTCAPGGRAPVIAVDIPSGMEGDTGRAAETFVRADVTVTFHAPKLGLYLTRERAAVGKIVVADIGLWQWKKEELTMILYERELYCSVTAPQMLRELPQKEITHHKGSCGRVLIYAGSLGMAGAAAMCAKAAIAAGAGLTTVACPAEIIPILQTLVPCAMCVDIAQAVKNPPAYDVLAVGCGLGQSEEIWENIQKIYDPEKYTVWDADALNLLAKHPIKLGKHAVITPHIGEAARLLERPRDAVMGDRLGAARALAEKFACTAVLKSDVTVICGKVEEEWFYTLNAVGTPALAKGGSGDVLTGILAALECTAEGRRNAAAMACLWHGMAGIVGEEEYGQRELNADELIACLHKAEQWGRGERPAPACFKG